ncbi:hypothetical protein NDU88_002274 [Pleurodeles waltl]|uniref:Uncharacterized protein n=1 Tax=Pleurodeles waltl TaxID=8319 RepID=A0AAV7M106_PLEWA|nr:hypothetical protein NDU88_002274 [Pleurodeles waltl]
MRLFINSKGLPQHGTCPGHARARARTITGHERARLCRPWLDEAGMDPLSLVLISGVTRVSPGFELLDPDSGGGGGAGGKNHKSPKLFVRTMPTQN